MSGKWVVRLIIITSPISFILDRALFHTLTLVF
jgi:hypothetical protein